MPQRDRILGGLVLLIAAACGSPATPTAPAVQPSPGLPPSASFEFTRTPIELTSRVLVSWPGYDWLGSYATTMSFSDIWSSEVVVAPASAIVQSVTTNGGDVRIDFLSPQGMRFYLSGLATATVKIWSRVEAGERVGTRGRDERFGRAFPVRLGLINPGAKLHFISPGRYPDEFRLGEDPLRYYAEPLRSNLRALRGWPDAEGRLDYDEPGTLMGLWFEESVPPAESLTATREQRLWFVYTNHAAWASFSGPTLRISLNTPLMSMGTPLPEAVHPRDITPASGFQVIRMQPSPDMPSWPALLLVEMLDSSRVRAESYWGPADKAPVGFTSKARVFIR